MDSSRSNPQSPEFPPGSIGAEQAGCRCEPERVPRYDCPLHGAVPTILRDLAEQHEAVFQWRKERAVRRLRWGFPFACAVTIALTETMAAVPVAIARPLFIGYSVTAVVVWWAWNWR